MGARLSRPLLPPTKGRFSLTFFMNCVVSVQIPRELFKAEGYAHKEALFGIPVYGGFIAEKLYYSSSTFLCSAPTADEASKHPQKHREAARLSRLGPSRPYKYLYCPANCFVVVMWSR